MTLYKALNFFSYEFIFLILSTLIPCQYYESGAFDVSLIGYSAYKI